MHDSASRMGSRHAVLMVSDFFFPNFGGVESHIFYLSQCLILRGHKVVVLTHAYGDRTGVRYLTNGLKVYYAPRLALTQAATPPAIFPPITLPLLRSVILRERITVVHVHQSYSPMAHDALLHASCLGVRAVMTDHSLGGFADAASIHLNKWLQFSTTCLDAAICVSHTGKENTVLRSSPSLPPHRVFVVPNAVDASAFLPLTPAAPASAAPAGATEGLRRGADGTARTPATDAACSTAACATAPPGTAVNEMGGAHKGTGTNAVGSVTDGATACEHNGSSSSSSHTITIVVVSRLVYRKGADLLVDLIPLVCQRHPQVRWIIGGDGAKRGRLEEMRDRNGLHSRVEMLGAVPHSRVRSVLVRGQIFVNSSLTEAFCIAILEAASCGLFVVSTRVGGVPEVLPPDMMLMAEPSASALADCVSQAIHMVPGIDGWKMHRRVARMYSWHTVAERTEAVYDSISEIPRLTLEEHLTSLYHCGPVAGKIFCLFLLLNYLFLALYRWWQPDSTIEVAPDLPSASTSPTSLPLNTQRQGGTPGQHPTNG